MRPTPRAFLPLVLIAALVIAGGYGCDNDPAAPAAGLDATDMTIDIGGSDGDTLADTAADVLSDTAADAQPDTAADATSDATADTTGDGDAAADTGADVAAPELFACQSDLDCVAMETQCCDHCNGGKALAVAKAYIAQAQSLYGPGNCAGVACTEMACAPSKVLCSNKKCALIATPSECSKLGAAECASTEGCMDWKALPQSCDGKDQPAKFFGCTGFKNCATVVTCATDPSGAKFSFPDNCLPPGFTATGSSDCCAKPSCTPAPAAKLCIRGKPVANGEEIAVGEPIQVQVYPKGCFSSSCTKKEVATCSLMPGNLTTFVQAEFCLASTAGPGGCTADCGGGGFASCGGGTWSAGEWPFSLSGTIVTVQVPSLLPFGGLCAGSQF
jgi:hypothetical protein